MGLTCGLGVAPLFDCVELPHEGAGPFFISLLWDDQVSVIVPLCGAVIINALRKID